MNTIDTLKHNLNQVKKEIKFAESYSLILEGMQNLEDYSFTSIAGQKMNLLGRLDFYEEMKFILNTYHVKHFSEIYEISFDKKINNPKWKAMSMAIKFYEKCMKEEEGNFWKIQRNLDRENKK